MRRKERAVLLFFLLRFRTQSLRIEQFRLRVGLLITRASLFFFCFFCFFFPATLRGLLRLFSFTNIGDTFQSKKHRRRARKNTFRFRRNLLFSVSDTVFQTVNTLAVMVDRFFYARGVYHTQSRFEKNSVTTAGNSTPVTTWQPPKNFFNRGNEWVIGRCRIWWVSRNVHLRVRYSSDKILRQS